jgi:SAM-dependent methyltransferase
MKFIKKILFNTISRYNSYYSSKRIKRYLNKGMISWSPGYSEYRTLEIIKAINNNSLLKKFINTIPQGFGLKLDERIVEYPWIFSNLSNSEGMLLDAGSTFNFEYIVNHPTVSRKQLSIFTFYPERNYYSSKRISYIFGDLRNMPFKDCLFDEIVCQSTLEHVDMDNSIYGYQIDNKASQMGKSYEYIKAISELHRVLKSKGMLLITFPFGKYENHGFFQQFDNEMVEKLMEVLRNGKVETYFFLYTQGGWRYSTLEECYDSISYNPHTGVGKGNDGAAHSRSICCIRFTKG